MTIDEVLHNLKDKAFCSSAAFPSKKATAAEQIILETEWTDYILNLVEQGNTHLLKNFRYRLVMDDGVEEEEEKEH
jgi:hypothetical protein